MFFKCLKSKLYRMHLEIKDMILIEPKTEAQKKIIRLIREIKNQREMLLRIEEAFQLYTIAKSATKIQGEFAEVGVYKGGSAKIIAEVKGDKELHLFDTFKGIPSVDDNDPEQLYTGRFIAEIEDVKEYLSSYKNIFIHRGLFPNTANSIKNKYFAFVNLDVDTYKSTLDALKFFYERMKAGGIIISHDYSTVSGVNKAFNEFFRNKKEIIIELFGTQCMVTKI